MRSSNVPQIAAVLAVLGLAFVVTRAEE